MKKFIVTALLFVCPLAFGAPLTQNYLPKANPAGGTNRQADSQVYDNGTNVGIGTSAPSAKFEVVGDIVSSGSGSYFQMPFLGADPSTPTSGNLKFYAKTDKSPYVIDDAGTVTTLLNQSGGWQDAGTDLRQVTTTDNVAIGTTTSASTKLLIHGNGTTTGSAFQVKDVNGLTKFTVQDGGSVGIGTFSPTGLFHVKHSAFPPVNFERTGAVTTTVSSTMKLKLLSSSVLTTGGVGQTFAIQGSGMGAEAEIGLIGFVRNGVDNSGDFVVYPYTAGTSSEKFRVTTGGNIGIGTTAPTDSLQSTGTIRAGGYKSSDGTAGATVTTCTGFKNGLCISGT